MRRGQRILNAALSLLACCAGAQSSFVVDGEELLRQPPAPVSREPLHMARLAGDLLTGELLPVCIGGDWRHPGASALPVLAVVALDARGVHDLRNLRAALLALDQHVREESADRVYEGVPTVRGPRHRYRDAVVRRSTSDVDAAEERATRSAAHVLESFMRAPGRRPVTVRHGGRFVSPSLPPGEYVLCGTARVRDGLNRPGTAQGLAVWWTPVSLATNTQMRYRLDETNAISWRDIFR